MFDDFDHLCFIVDNGIWVWLNSCASFIVWFFYLCFSLIVQSCTSCHENLACNYTVDNLTFDLWTASVRHFSHHSHKLNFEQCCYLNWSCVTTSFKLYIWNWDITNKLCYHKHDPQVLEARFRFQQWIIAWITFEMQLETFQRLLDFWNDILFF